MFDFFTKHPSRTACGYDWFAQIKGKVFGKALPTVLHDKQHRKVVQLAEHLTAKQQNRKPKEVNFVSIAS